MMPPPSEGRGLSLSPLSPLGRRYHDRRQPVVTRRLAASLVLAGVLVAVTGEAAPPPSDPFGAVAGAVARPVPCAPPADPFPIRRVYVAGDQLTAALGRATKGSLVRLPRDEFEAKVRAAAAATSGPPPRLVEARYRATLSDAGLTGTAEWKVA